MDKYMNIDPRQIVLNQLTLKGSKDMELVIKQDIDITSFDLGADGGFHLRGTVKVPPLSATEVMNRSMERRRRIASLLKVVKVRADGTIIETTTCDPRWIYPELRIENGILVGQCYGPLNYVQLPNGTHAETKQGSAFYNEEYLPELGFVVSVKNDEEGIPYYIRLELK